MKKNIKLILIFVILIILLIALTGCSNESTIIPTNAIIDNNNLEFSVDYNDAETFEKDLNNGVNVENKIVKFKVIQYNLDTLYGNNAWAGEHLNFISKDDPQLNIDDEVVCKIISINNKFGSWYINYEILEIIKKENNNLEIKTENQENNTNKEDNISTNTLQNENSNIISQKNNENQNDTSEQKNVIYYEDDETINKYITLFNNLYSENKITNDMLSTYYHHGREHKNQVKFSMDNLDIILTANYKNSMSISIDNSNDDNVVIKNLVKKFVSVFDSSITEEKINSYIDSQGAGSSIDTYENIEYWTNKDANGERIISLKITGKLK